MATLTPTPTADELLGYLSHARSTTLNNRELGDAFDVTDRALRTAIARLEDAGLVTVERWRPNFVAGDTGRRHTITTTGRQRVAEVA